MLGPEILEWVVGRKLPAVRRARSPRRVVTHKVIVETSESEYETTSSEDQALPVKKVVRFEDDDKSKKKKSALKKDKKEEKPSESEATSGDESDAASECSSCKGTGKVVEKRKDTPSESEARYVIFCLIVPQRVIYLN